MALPDSSIGEWRRGTDPALDLKLDEFFPPDFMRTHTRFRSVRRVPVGEPP